MFSRTLDIDSVNSKKKREANVPAERIAAVFAVHRSPFTVHRSPFAVRRSTFDVRRSPFDGVPGSGHG